MYLNFFRKGYLTQDALYMYDIYIYTHTHTHITKVTKGKTHATTHIGPKTIFRYPNKFMEYTRTK